MFRYVSLALLIALILLIGLMTAEPAAAHGSCQGWSERRVGHGRIAWGGRTTCSEEATLIGAISGLWSFDLIYIWPIRLEDWAWDGNHDSTQAHAHGNHSVIRGRCLTVVSGHGVHDYHGNLWPWTWWNHHLWFKTSILRTPMIICR